jgi:hypothetical protein
VISQADRDLIEDLQLASAEDEIGGTGDQAQHVEVPLPS